MHELRVWRRRAFTRSYFALYFVYQVYFILLQPSSFLFYGIFVNLKEKNKEKYVCIGIGMYIHMYDTNVNKIVCQFMGSFMWDVKIFVFEKQCLFIYKFYLARTNGGFTKYQFYCRTAWSRLYLELGIGRSL